MNRSLANSKELMVMCKKKNPFFIFALLANQHQHNVVFLFDVKV